MDTESYIDQYRRRLGRFMRQKRIAEGWSQRTLAEHADMLQNQISSYENGGNMDLVTLLKLDRILGLGFFKLLEDEALDAWAGKTRVEEKT